MSHTVLFEVFRRDGMSHQDFQDHWLKVHAPIAAELPDMLSYRIYIAADDPERPAEAPDGFVVQEYPSAEACSAAMASEVMQRAGADAASFARHFTPFDVTKHDVVGAG